LRVTPEIVHAFKFLLGPESGRADKAKAIALGESFNSHNFVRDLIVAVATERDNAVAIFLKEKAAAEKAGTSRERPRDSAGTEGEPGRPVSPDLASASPEHGGDGMRET